MRRAGILLLLLLAACGEKKTEDSRSVFNLNLSSGSLESLDPAYAKDLYTLWTTHMIYNTLVETDQALHITPSLATSWEISADRTRYRFHLKPDVFFQDAPEFPGGKGRKMLASDVVYSFQRLVDPSIASSGAWIFNDRIAADSPFVAVDDSTFELRLRAPFQPMLPMLSMPYCSIVPSEVTAHWGKAFRRHPCGTGPFRYFDWDEGNALILHKNPQYWEHNASGQRLPYLDAVRITFFDSKATEFLLFLQHKLEFCKRYRRLV